MLKFTINCVCELLLLIKIIYLISNAIFQLTILGSSVEASIFFRSLSLILKKVGADSVKNSSQDQNDFVNNFNQEIIQPSTSSTLNTSEISSANEKQPSNASLFNKITKKFSFLLPSKMSRKSPRPINIHNKNQFLIKLTLLFKLI
ncbi:hypothetical protein BpHYR1_027601 [Brachionus plicatilis]|uniref:Transmembrane protein n=1 Tax=Brachionus plicatilis TaxID=10195 RepID=A0A3M7Q7C4_BRAPC|nr:hypothetical protein BpHYR1_027601 [Brachionus plicatilis]